MKIKSPLRYPGGKSRAVDKITKYFPEKLDVLVSPFFGGGSIEIATALKGTTVKGYDVFAPLVCFWQHLLADRQALYDVIQTYHPLSKERFVKLQKENPLMDCSIDQAAMFYVLNRSSFSGSTMCGGISPDHPRFNHSNMQTVLKFNVPTLTVEHADFVQSITRNPGAFMYLDPPYLLSENANNLYGVRGSTHRAFDHATLFDLVKDRDDWVMSYNSGGDILKIYEDHPIISLDWQYGMGNNKNSREILIASKNMASMFPDNESRIS